MTKTNTRPPARQGRLPQGKQKKSPRRIARAPLLLSPATALHPLAAMLGWILRAALAALGGYAFTLFLGDAAGVLKLSGRVRDEIVGDPSGLLPLSLLVAAVCLLFALSRISALLATLGVVGGAVLLFVQSGPARIREAENAFRCLINRTLIHLTERGYTSLADALLDTTYTHSEKHLLTTALSILCAVLTVFFAFLLLRRVRPLGCAILCTVLLVPVFVYNVTKTNRGVFLVITFIAGVLALWMYDRRFGLSGARHVAAEKKRSARRAEKRAARERRRAAKERAESAIIDAYDRGGTRREARMAGRAVLAAARAEEKAIRQERCGKPKPEKADKETRRAARAERRQARHILWRRMAGGGYFAAVASLLACLALLIPNALVEENFPVIEALDNRIRIARMYATAYLMGDDVDLNGLSLYGGVSDLNPRTVSFASPRFTGERIFEVESGYNAPVYLRSWIGTQYDLETDTWRSATQDDVLAYRAQFGRSFTSDMIGQNFKKYTYPLATDTSKFDLFYGYSRYGFVVTQTNIRRVGGTSRLLFTPTYLNTDSGIMEYGSIAPNEYAVSAYYDGVYSSRFFTVPGRAYSAYSYLTMMKDENLAETFDAQTQYYLLSLAYADRVEEIEASAALSEADADFTALLAEYDAEVEMLGASYRGTSILSRYIEMSDAERQAYRRTFETEEAYSAYAHGNFTGSFGSERIADLAMQILADNGWVVTESSSDSILADCITDAESGTSVLRHDLILAVLDHIKNGGYTYTLTPKGSETETEGSSLETFLFETKEGYCVHFATATAAILREYGLAVRYDEGYLVGDFKKNRMEVPLTNFSANVYDYNAHAWIEVYYPLMGWVQYECTPAYMDAIYSVDEGYEITPIIPASDRNPLGGEETEIEDLPEEEEEDELPLLPFVLAGGVLLVTALSVLFVLRSRRRRHRREEWILDAKSGEADAETVRHICTAILDIYRALGCPPQRGELPDAYALRIRDAYPNVSATPFTDVMPLILKSEFGGGLTAEECRTLGVCLAESCVSVYAGVSLPRRFHMRHVICVI